MEREAAVPEGPRDVLTGLQSGPPAAVGPADVLVGYLVTLADGYQVRFEADRTRAALYAARNHGTIEPMFVRR